MSDDVEELTENQEHDICYIIGDWYLIWKHCLFNIDEHKDYIDCAVYMLKNMIKYANNRYENIKWVLNEDQLKEVYFAIDVWRQATPPQLSAHSKLSHNFGFQKEILKMMICKKEE